MSVDDRPVAKAAKKQWGALRSLLKHGRTIMTPEQHAAAVRDVNRHVKSASDTIPPELEKKLGNLMRQMHTTTLFEDEEDTLLPDEFEPLMAGSGAA